LEEQAFDLIVDQFEVLLDLVDSELVLVVADGAVGVGVGLGVVAVGGVEEVVPVELLVVPRQVLREGDGGELGNAQLQADGFNRLRGRNLLPSQEVPHEQQLADCFHDVLVGHPLLDAPAKIFEAQSCFFLHAAVVDAVQEVDKLL
jgi:hypothetical protein